MNPPDNPRDPQAPDSRDEPPDGRGLALLIGTFVAALLLTGLAVLLLAQLFL